MKHERYKIEKFEYPSGDDVLVFKNSSDTGYHWNLERRLIDKYEKRRIPKVYGLGWLIGYNEITTSYPERTFNFGTIETALEFVKQEQEHAKKFERTQLIYVDKNGKQSTLNKG